MEIKKPTFVVFESFVLPNHQHVCVAKFATRYFNLVGHVDHALADADVQGPYDTHADAVRRARLLQGHEYEMHEKRSAS